MYTKDPLFFFINSYSVPCSCAPCSCLSASLGLGCALCLFHIINRAASFALDHDLFLVEKLDVHLVDVRLVVLWGGGGGGGGLTRLNKDK